MIRRPQLPFILALIATLAVPVPFLSPSAQAQNSAPITIGAADVQDRELALMRETRKHLAETARALALEASADSEAIHTAAYALAWQQYQEQLNRARKRVWWNKTPDVTLASVPRPSSTALAARNRELATIQLQREQAERQAAQEAAELNLRAEQLRTQQEIAHQQRIQSAAALEQTALLEEIYHRGALAPLYPVGPQHPIAHPPLRKPVVFPRPAHTNDSRNKPVGKARHPIPRVPQRL